MVHRFESEPSTPESESAGSHRILRIGGAAYWQDDPSPDASYAVYAKFVDEPALFNPGQFGPSCGSSSDWHETAPVELAVIPGSDSAAVVWHLRRFLGAIEKYGLPTSDED